MADNVRFLESEIQKLQAEIQMQHGEADKARQTAGGLRADSATEDLSVGAEAKASQFESDANANELRLREMQNRLNDVQAEVQNLRNRIEDIRSRADAEIQSLERQIDTITG